MPSWLCGWCAKDEWRTPKSKSHSLRGTQSPRSSGGSMRTTKRVSLSEFKGLFDSRLTRDRCLALSLKELKEYLLAPLGLQMFDPQWLDYFPRNMQDAPDSFRRDFANELAVIHFRWHLGTCPCRSGCSWFHDTPTLPPISLPPLETSDCLAGAAPDMDLPRPAPLDLSDHGLAQVTYSLPDQEPGHPVPNSSSPSLVLQDPTWSPGHRLQRRRGVTLPCLSHLAKGSTAWSTSPSLKRNSNCWTMPLASSPTRDPDMAQNSASPSLVLRYSQRCRTPSSKTARFVRNRRASRCATPLSARAIRGVKRQGGDSLTSSGRSLASSKSIVRSGDDQSVCSLDSVASRLPVFSFVVQRRPRSRTWS